MACYSHKSKDFCLLLQHNYLMLLNVYYSQKCRSIIIIMSRPSHYRVEEGSEHYVLYAFEKKYQRSFIHGHVVGLGVYIMSRLQENGVDKITQFMDSIGLKYHPRDLGESREVLKEILLYNATGVCSSNDLWNTVVNERNISKEAIEQHNYG